MRIWGIWLAATTASLLGTRVLAFAMAWEASAHGGVWSAAVLTAIVLPRTVLLPWGGATVDRAGPGRGG